MGQCSFIKTIIKNAKNVQKTLQNDKIYNNFKNHLTKEIAKEKPYRKDIGKNHEKYNKPYVHKKTDEVSFNAKEAGKAYKDYIKASLNNLQNYKKGNLMQIQKEMFDKEFSN